MLQTVSPTLESKKESPRPLCQDGRLGVKGGRRDRAAMLVEISLLLAVLFLGPNPVAVKVAESLHFPS